MKENDYIEPLVDEIVLEPRLLLDQHFNDMLNIAKVEETIMQVDIEKQNQIKVMIDNYRTAPPKTKRQRMEKS